MKIKLTDCVETAKLLRRLDKLKPCYVIAVVEQWSVRNLQLDSSVTVHSFRVTVLTAAWERGSEPAWMGNGGLKTG